MPHPTPLSIPRMERGKGRGKKLDHLPMNEQLRLMPLVCFGEDIILQRLKSCKGWNPVKDVYPRLC